ncbi:T9SS sorting signal type C domain-containing protein [Flavobacterium caeni]|uniref:Por secretion system C-terminal sorting domain-containing protein n=1 Tax=Flavobacterium caeni TaxID=490189 RepID=A0A1G5J3K3_9FLAO|nr:T9SS sorting signal type C domain-containing protein [Flavobacterium caeni]SCY82936.1 Por secretion system C-terminal sorting domain-containing protein [Flavobacterium caeni]
MERLYFACFGLLMVTTIAKAQVYVSPDSYIFVNDRMVFVNQDINLDKVGAVEGNIYLRDEAMLLQGASTVVSTNRGAGTLSVFQEGTVNNFAYNYWCSPVGNASAATGNENFKVSMLHRPTTTTASTPAVMLGAGVFDGVANPLRIADRWAFKFVSSSTYAQWVPVPGGAALPNIEPGIGYTLKGSGTAVNDLTFSDNGQANNPGSRQRYDFRGKPNDGNITVFVGAGLRTLTGNPYPSAIDLRAFLMAATNTTQVAYFWEQDPTTNSHLIASYRGGYGSYSPLAAGGVTDPTYGYMGVYNPPTFYAYDGAGTQLGATGTGTPFERRFCPIGQGFMIEGAAGGNVTMSNNYRVYIKEGTFSDFNRPADVNEGTSEHTSSTGFLPPIQSVAGWDYTTVSTAPAPQIKFQTLLNNTGVKETTLVMIDGASDGAESGMDAKSPDQTDIDMYFVLDNAQYVISVIDFDVNKKVPVGFKANVPASFRIKATEMINFSEAENVYLHDKLTDMYYDIKNSDYEFTLPAGTNDTQYEITFVDGLLGTSDELAADAFAILQNNDRQMLTVSNPGSIDIKSVTLFDITGKQIFTKTKLGAKTSYEFPTSGLAESIYVVKVVTTDNKQFAKKISVFEKGK